MILVPLKGDTITTKDGVQFQVTGFTNYKEKAPAVYVEHTPAVPSDAVYFFDIAKINDKTVEFMSGPKLFKSSGPMKRKWQLPQPNDIITWKSPEGSQDILVKSLKLHKRGELGKGLLILGVNKDTDEQVTVRLKQITDLTRDIGNDLFSRDRFMAYYSDYTGG